MSGFFAYLTPAGRNLVSQAVAGGAAVQLTEFAVGSSEIAHSELSFTLGAEEHRAPVDTVDRPFDDQALVQVTGALGTEVGDFWIREVGVYASTGELFAVANVPPTFKVADGQGVTKDLFYRLQIRVSESDAVTLVSDPALALVSRDELDAAVAGLQAVSGAVEIYHHNAQGKDSNSGRSPNDPVKTWARVTELLVAGRHCRVNIINELIVNSRAELAAPPSLLEFVAHDGTGPTASEKNIRFQDTADDAAVAGGMDIGGALTLSTVNCRLLLQWGADGAPFSGARGRIDLSMNGGRLIHIDDNPTDRAIFDLQLGGHLRFEGVIIAADARGRIVEGIAAGSDPNALPGVSSNLTSL